MFDATRLLQTLTDALSLGSLYALIAIGYTMVYGVLRLINFAHGEIFMIAMYIVFYGISMFSLPWYATFAVTILVTALLGTLAERLAYRPLRNAPRISILISAIGVSYFLQNLATVLFGGEQQMLAVDRAMMSRPKVLMMDEPSLGLAPLIVKDIFSIIRRVNADGITVLLIEQNANAALRVADYGYVLETGTIALTGTGEELLRNESVREAYLGKKK